MTPDQLSQSGTESGNQRALFDAVRRGIASGVLPLCCELMYAIPNGDKRDPRIAAKLKAEGVKPGVPDIFLPVPRSVFHGLYIELKRPESTYEQDGKIKKRREGKASDAQNEMIGKLVAMGYGVNVCVGWQSAYDTIVAYCNQ